MFEEQALLYVLGSEGQGCAGKAKKSNSGPNGARKEVEVRERANRMILGNVKGRVTSAIKH